MSLRTFCPLPAFLMLVPAAACGGAGSASMGQGDAGADVRTMSKDATAARPDAGARDSSVHDASRDDVRARDADSQETGPFDARLDALSDVGPRIDAADAASTDGGADACVPSALATHLYPGNVLVVFDQSDSMNQAFSEADGGSSGPKYKVAEDAVVSGFSPQEANLNAGVVFFPTTATGNTCSTVAPYGVAPQIALEPGATFLTAFQAHFSSPGWSLILGTPMVAALAAVAAGLPDASSEPGPTTVVLVTDGTPTCDTVEADLVTPAQALFARGIKTYVIGLPGSASAASLLNAVAQAGGTTTYLSPSTPAALSAVFADIAGDAERQCTVLVDSPPANAGEVRVFVTDPMAPSGYFLSPGDGGDAWSLSADHSTVTLVGSACATELAGGFTSIEVVYGCAGSISDGGATQ